MRLFNPEGVMLDQRARIGSRMAAGRQTRYRAVPNWFRRKHALVGAMPRRIWFECDRTRADLWKACQRRDAKDMQRLRGVRAGHVSERTRHLFEQRGVPPSFGRS